MNRLLTHNIQVWKEKRYEDAHFAEVVTELKPSDVNLDLTGDFIACVFRTGFRTFMFHGQTNRDRFVNHYRGRGFNARPCKDPHP